MRNPCHTLCSIIIVNKKFLFIMFFIFCNFSLLSLLVFFVIAGLFHLLFIMTNQSLFPFFAPRLGINQKLNQK
uniref:Uncharacterized protein n=1 Tax=Lotus japonicus TaxID=34305 RepID=I3SGP9_LOTJA|nr:unknown [Lotus japonicus]